MKADDERVAASQSLTINTHSTLSLYAHSSLVNQLNNTCSTTIEHKYAHLPKTQFWCTY